MKRIFDYEPRVIGSVEGVHQHKRNEGDDVEDDMGLNDIVNEHMDIILKVTIITAF